MSELANFPECVGIVRLSLCACLMFILSVCFCIGMFIRSHICQDVTALCVCKYEKVRHCNSYYMFVIIMNETVMLHLFSVGRKKFFWTKLKQDISIVPYTTFDTANRIVILSIIVTLLRLANRFPLRLIEHERLAHSVVLTECDYHDLIVETDRVESFMPKFVEEDIIAD